MSADLRPELIAWEFFCVTNYGLGPTFGDDEDDHPSLKEALLQVLSLTLSVVRVMLLAPSLWLRLHVHVQL